MLTTDRILRPRGIAGVFLPWLVFAPLRHIRRKVARNVRLNVDLFPEVINVGFVVQDLASACY
jgi:hypothetical protein